MILCNLKYFTCFPIIFLISSHTYSQSKTYNLDIKAYNYSIETKDKKVEIPAEIGSFEVKENRKNKNSRTIKLSFVRFKSTSEKAGSPIVYLAGGPGGSGINAAGGPRHDIFMALREFGDVIALDQRGTGLSDFFTPCKTLRKFPLDSALTMTDLLGVMEVNAKNAISKYKNEGIDVEGYSILQNADDLEDLRLALRVPKLTLWGISFGSQLAFAFINRHPGSVDKVILAALEAPSDNIKYPFEVQGLLEKVDTILKSDPATNTYYPDLLGLMKTVLNKFEANPVTVQLTNQKTSLEEKVVIGKLEIQLILSYFLLKNPQTLRQVPLLFYNMNNGHFQQVAPMAVRIKDAAVNIEPMALLTDAMTGVDAARIKEVKKQAEMTLLGRTTNYPFPDISNNLGLQDIGKKERRTPQSAVKGLFFSATLDGRTFLPSAKKIIRNFPNVQHVIIENAGHDMFEASPKVKDLIISNMRGEQVESTILLPPVKFLLPVIQ